MTLLQALSLVILGGILALSIWRKTNIGILGYTATLVLALLAHANAATSLSAFPTDLVILVIGVSLLFAHAERSGAVHWLIGLVLRRIGQRRWLIPWAGFVAGAALSTIGAFPTAPISLLLPVLGRLAKAYRLDYLTLAIICVWSANAAGLSPLSPAGALVRTIAEHKHLNYSPWGLYAVVVALHAVLAAALLGVQSAVRRLRDRRSTSSGEAIPTPEQGLMPIAGGARLGAYPIACLVSLMVMVTSVVAFRLDLGLVALALAAVLHLAFRTPEREILAKVPWSVVLLLSGLVIYLGLLDKIGTLRSIENAVSHIGSTVALLFALVYITAIVSNLESSTLVVLGVMVPIGLGLTSHDQSGLLAVLVAVVMSAAVVAISPVHIGGALIISNAAAEDQQSAYRKVFLVAGIVAAIVPGLMILYPIAVGV